LSQPAAGNVEGDPRQPRPEPIRIAEPGEADQGQNNGLLDGIVGQMGVVEHASGQGRDHRPMPRHQLGEGLLVPTDGPSNQLSVTQ